MVSPFCAAFSFEGTSALSFGNYDKLQTQLDFRECGEIVIPSRYFEVHVLPENVSTPWQKWRRNLIIAKF